MELIKNLISPRARRKKLELAGGDTGGNIIPSSSPRLFGVPLEELMSSAPPNATVPPVVSRICEYIYKYGLDNVGLFRVSGSVRVVERMRMQFELMGDVNLEEENDVAAAAGLLRVFLRDLPDTLVPARLTRTFFSVIQNPQLERETVVTEMKKSLDQLPEENYNLLKYISSLLSVVAENETENKMSAVSLAILFGPNIFKYELTSGLGGLKDMDSSKDVMHLFISEYKTFFEEAGDLSPQEFWESCRVKKTPPPRPPPPKVQSLPSFFSETSGVSTTLAYSASSSSLDNYPVPSPRKVKNIGESNSNLDVDGKQTSLHPVSHMLPLFSPRDDADHTRAYSPFTLESDTHSIIESPMITARTHELVEKTIVETISEHIFGGFDFNQNSGPQSPKSPRKSSFLDRDLENESSVDASVEQSTSTIPPSSAGINGKTMIPSSSVAVHESTTAEEDLENLERTDILVGHKKSQGPPRRTPSYKHRHNLEVDENPRVNVHPRRVVISKSVNEIRSQNHSLNHMQGNTDKENEEFYSAEFDKDRPGSSPPFKPRSVHRNDSRALMTQSPSMQNKSEPSSSQFSSSSNGSSVMDKSPGSSIKLFIPPLDFSTLHEHVDGVDPIPVSQQHSDTQMWIKTSQLTAGDTADVAIISPRSNKLKKLNDCPDLETPVSIDVEAPMSPSAYYGSGLFRASLNTDIPPSPPIHQDLFKKYSGDDGSHKLRQMTKKIQGLKKKIKSFEESFENEHGYKPSHGEKSAQPDVKKYMSELSKVRKDLKRLKDDTEKGNRSRHNSGASSSGVELSPPVTPSVVTTLEFILRCLKDKRQDAGRPDEVMLMSRDQVQEEKLAVQRALLHFEGLHGRPSTREEKDLMRPLYDRYRSVKRMLAKPMSPRNSLELQTVPEDKMIEIPRSFNRDTIRIPTADSEQDDSVSHEFGFVTRDMTVVRGMNFPTSLDKGLQQAGGGGKDDIKSEDSRGDVRLHEMSLSELHVEIENSRGQKKRLRRNLREFEEDFFEKNGRKVQKEDRHYLQSDYGDYKKVKARLRLLEALILKHHE